MAQQQNPSFPATLASLQALTLLGCGASADLRFLEDWHRQSHHNPGLALRARQLRRAQPVLVAAIGMELALDC